MEGGGFGPVEVLSQRSTEGTEINEHLSEDNRCTDRDSNRGPPEYKSRALRLEKRIRSSLFINPEVPSSNIDLVNVTAIGNLKSGRHRCSSLQVGWRQTEKFLIKQQKMSRRSALIMQCPDCRGNTACAPSGSHRPTLCIGCSDDVSVLAPTQVPCLGETP